VLGRAWRDNDFDMGVLFCELNQVLLEVLTITTKKESMVGMLCEYRIDEQQIGLGVLSSPVGGPWWFGSCHLFSQVS